MKVRRIYIAAALALFVAGVSLALYYRSYEKHPETITEEQMERLTARFTGNAAREMSPVPTREELEKNAGEVVWAKVNRRTGMADYDVLSEMEVVRVLCSASGLREGEKIWVYEPYKLYVNPNLEKARSLDIVFEEGWIDTDGFQLPLREGDSYLLFIKRREITDYYHYSDRDEHTFLFSDRLVSAFPAGKKAEILMIGPQMSGADSETGEEVSKEVWKEYKQYDFVVPGEEQKEQLLALIREIEKWCGEP